MAFGPSRSSALNMVFAAARGQPRYGRGTNREQAESARLARMDRVLFHRRRLLPVTARDRCSMRRPGCSPLLLVALLVDRRARSRGSAATRPSSGARPRGAASAETSGTWPTLMQVQSEMTGRMQTMAEIFGSRTSDLARLVNERLDAQGQRVGQAHAGDQHQDQRERSSKLNERLAVIDRAQTNITELSQGRGVAAVDPRQQADARRLRPGPDGSDHRRWAARRARYAFQYTLSNDKRPDCVVFMPNGAPPAGDRRQVSARELAADERGADRRASCAWRGPASAATCSCTSRRSRRST